MVPVCLLIHPRHFHGTTKKIAVFSIVAVSLLVQQRPWKLYIRVTPSTMIRQKKLTMPNKTHPFKSEWNNSKHFLKLACGHQDLNRNIQTMIWTTMIQLITTTVFPFCPTLAYFALCCSTFVEIKFNKFTSTFCKVIKL